MKAKKVKEPEPRYLPFAPLPIPISAKAEKDLMKRMAKMEQRLSLFEALVKEMLKHVDIYTFK